MGMFFFIIDELETWQQFASNSMFLYVFMILLWHYWYCTASTKKKNINRKMKNEVKDEDELWELYYQKWWHVSRDCEVFHGKKNVTYSVVIHCILRSLRIRLFTRICMRHKLALRNTIMTVENKRLFTPCFSSHIIFIHCYRWYQERINWKLWNKTALGARYHVDQCLNFKKLNINNYIWWNYTWTLILAVLLWSWTFIFPFIKVVQSFLHAYMKIIIVFFLLMNIHNTCNMLCQWTI